MVHEYKFRYSKPGIDAKELDLAWWDYTIAFSADSEKGAEKKALELMPKTTYKHNGKIYKSQPVVLEKVVKWF